MIENSRPTAEDNPSDLSPVPGNRALYVVYLGGDAAPGRLGEDHEVVLVVADDVTEARKVARAKWGGSSRPHIDAVRAVDVVDGYRIRLEQTDQSESVEVDTTYEPAEP